MSANTQHAGRGRKTAPHGRERYYLDNSTVIIEDGLTGPVARIVRRDGIEYAGPLPKGTIDALAEVAHGRE